jgi:hypothetical protein
MKYQHSARPAAQAQHPASLQLRWIALCSAGGGARLPPCFEQIKQQQENSLGKHRRQQQGTLFATNLFCLPSTQSIRICPARTRKNLTISTCKKKMQQAGFGLCFRNS